MMGLQRKGTNAAATAAFLLHAILLSHSWMLAHGLTPRTAGRRSAGTTVWTDRSHLSPLYGATAIAPAETKPTKVVNNNRVTLPVVPGRRRAQNKQFLLKRWKSQQAVAKLQKIATDSNEQETKSKLVSVIGMSAATIEKQAKELVKKPSTNQQKTVTKRKKITSYQPDQEKPKIWNTKFDQPPTTTKKATSKSTEGLLSWSSLVPGSMVSGTVVKTLPYGVLVQTSYDIPGRTPGRALLVNHHLLDSEEEPAIPGTTKKQLLPVGTEIVNARVINLNRERGTVHLSLRPPDKRIVKGAVLRVGDQVEGKVVRLKPYGAFVDVGHKRNALLHLSRMSMYKVDQITDHVRVGQTINVRILRMTDKDIALSMLSKENDAFVDRRELQARRMALWQQVVSAVEEAGEELERAKKELLEVDRLIWDHFLAHDNGAPRSVEV